MNSLFFISDYSIEQELPPSSQLIIHQSSTSQPTVSRSFPVHIGTHKQSTSQPATIEEGVFIHQPSIFQPVNGSPNQTSSSQGASSGLTGKCEISKKP